LTMKSKTMKEKLIRAVSILLSTVTVFALMGCEQANLNVPEAKTETTAEASKVESGDGVTEDATSQYQLEQVVVLSRHNLRAPLSSNGSVPQELTPHQWIEWTAKSSELTTKGGIQETNMGQYFRKWLDKEGLIPENSIPEGEEIRFNARAKQRCRATARYFAAGMLPLADINIEYPSDSNDLEDFMKPNLKFYSDDYAADAQKQVEAMGGDAGFEGLADETRDAIKLIMDTVDMQDSEAYKSGKYGDLMTDGSGYKMAADEEPDVTGAIKTASQVADALILQYYENTDSKAAAFGHDLEQSDWAKIGGLMTRYEEIKFGAPLVSVNIAHPLIQELEDELQNEERKFSFLCAHDCTVFTALCALGVKPYTLPDSIETRTPIGVKILFERWRDQAGQAWYRVDLVYRSIEQIRESSVLSLDNPPMRYDLSFEGVETNEDGLISEADLLGLFDRTLAEYDELLAKYTGETLDKAA
ncbi:Histidine acid phosphatase, partial [Lachnospiraceae bacterium JC7]